MSIELFSFSVPLGAVGVTIIVASLMAALILNCMDKSRSKGSAAVLEAVKPTAVASAGPISAAAAMAPAKVEDTRPHYTILFGTQTGTAERFAKSLKSQLESKYGASSAFNVSDLEHYNYKERLPQEKLVFFLVATYGDGEPTDDAAEFFDWLIEQAGGDNEDLCKGTSFGVFGLGNRQYEHFCAVGKNVHKAMEELGGSAVVKAGTGDDDDDIDEDFDGWCADLFAALEASNLLVAGSGDAAASSVAAYDVEMVADAPLASVDVLISGTGANHSSPFLATVSSVRELHSHLSDRSCVHVELDITGCKATYETGDHVAIFAENSPEIVAAAAAALGQQLDTCFRLRLPSGNADGLPEPPSGVMSLRGALSRYADLLSAPSKAALAALAAFATNPSDTAKLAELASIEGREAYHAYIVANKRSLLEVMRAFPSARPPLGAFFGSIAPHLQPRFYSISSSPAAHPRSVHVTAAVVRETMPSGRLHHGVASSWLATASPGTKVPMFLRRSAFKLPRDPATPIVMVGPGTGLAPFRGFLQERMAALAKRGGKANALGPGVLFFGCRRRDQDYIYQVELEDGVAQGAISALNVAFSRQTAAKDYVQHHMAKQGTELWEMLGPQGKGYLYVCGDAKNMAKDVHAVLLQIATAATGGDAAKGEAAVKQLADAGRYHKDVW